MRIRSQTAKGLSHLQAREANLAACMDTLAAQVIGFRLTALWRQRQWPVPCSVLLSLGALQSRNVALSVSAPQRQLRFWAPHSGMDWDVCWDFASAGCYVAHLSPMAVAYAQACCALEPLGRAKRREGSPLCHWARNICQRQAPKQTGAGAP